MDFIQEALSIFEMEPPLSHDIIKQQYRRLAMRYHPDRCAGDTSKMQSLNTMRDQLMQMPAHALAAYKIPAGSAAFWVKLGLLTGVEDGKLWVGGDTYRHRDLLKQHCFKWCPIDRAWWRYL
jgi:hypothetical protein